MNTTITSHLQQLDEHLKWSFEQARSLSTEQFHQQPSPDSWSMCQVLEHILQSETGTLGYMMKKSSSGWEALEDEGAEQKQNGVALSTRLQSNEKYKAPAILPEPTNTTSLESFESNWPKLRTQLSAFVQSVDPQFHNKLVFKQPLAGMLTLPSTTAFLSSHFKHHMPQIESILLNVRP
ncbi:MAG: hypothetical protein RLZZ262_2229 [Bacteroidota bacterium]|jgi:hypothetical protein